MFGKRGEPGNSLPGVVPAPHQGNGQYPRTGVTPGQIPDLKVQPAAPFPAQPTPPPRPAASFPQGGQRPPSVPQAVAPPPPKPPSGASPRRSDNYYDIKSTIFNALIDAIDLTQLSQ